MDRTTSWVVGIVVVLVVLGGAWYFTSQPAPATEGPAATSTPTGGIDNATGSTDASTGVSVGGSVSVGTTHTVRLTSSGFSPSTVDIKKGDKVTWVNDTASSMWVASAQHPTHTAYAGTSLSEHCSGGMMTAFDQCAAGSSYTFTFDKTGMWRYHNHSNSSQSGSVVVTE